SPLFSSSRQQGSVSWIIGSRGMEKVSIDDRLVHLLTQALQLLHRLQEVLRRWSGRRGDGATIGLFEPGRTLSGVFQIRVDRQVIHRPVKVLQIPLNAASAAGRHGAEFLSNSW